MRRVSGFARAIGRYASAMLDAEPQRVERAVAEVDEPERLTDLEQLVGSLCFRVEHAGSTDLPPDGASRGSSLQSRKRTRAGGFRFSHPPAGSQA